MANFNLPEEPEFSIAVRKLETTDPAHADLFNAIFLQLLINDSVLKKVTTENSYITNASTGIKYEIGMDENGVYFVESDDNPETVTQIARGLKSTDTVAVTMEEKTYGVENASATEEEIPEGGSVFTIV